MPLRVLRVYHAGRDPQHRERERALVAAGVEVTLVVPERWPDGGAQARLPAEPFEVVEVAVRRAGNVNAHRVADRAAPGRLLQEHAPDILDVHEEPFSEVAHQWLAAAPARLPVVIYTAQNIDKRYPPPYRGYERRALGRASGLYPCTRQAAAVARGKGYGGPLRVLPLGYDAALYRSGKQAPDAAEVLLVLAGRLVAEKGVADAVRVLAAVNAVRPARLVLAGDGPLAEPARALAVALGVGERVEIRPWLDGAALAALYREAHVTLVPSIATATWTEQYGRVITEAQASGSLVAGYASGSIAEVAGAAGVLVEPGAAAALARAVLALLADGDEFERRRAGGLRLAAERSWERVARGQVELYELAREPRRIALPASPRARRALARAEFGASAPALAGERPFALPWLRDGGRLSGLLAAAIDAGAELRARLAP
jgi:glycosyltransferase involved in cell wall biosynthesis